MPRKYGKKTSAPEVVEDPTSLVGVVDFSQDVYRWLYNPLYNAVLEQALAIGDTEESVRFKFSRLVAGDPTHGLTAEIVDNKVQSYCSYHIVGTEIVIEHFVGTREFIKAVQDSFESDLAPTKCIHPASESAADFFIDELDYEVQRVVLVKSFTKEE